MRGHAMTQFGRSTGTPDLREAILREITEDDGCPLGDLLELEEHHDGNVTDEVMTSSVMVSPT